MKSAIRNVSRLGRKNIPAIMQRRNISNQGNNLVLDPIVPKMWTGTAPIPEDAYVIDVTNEHMMDGPEGNPALAAKMLKQFEDVGLVLMRGQPNLADRLDVMREWAKVCMPNLVKYEGGANTRHGKIENVYEVGAPTNAFLHYHHEMAYINDTIKCLGFCATDVLEPKPDDPLRGASYVSCNLRATDDVLKTPFGQKLKEKGVTYIRCLTNKAKYEGNDMVDGVELGIYNHWQTSFMTDDKAEAQKRAEAKGLVVEWGEDDYMKTKFTVSGFEYFPPLDRNLFYCAIADHGNWFDTWPGMDNLPYMSTFEGTTALERPLAMTFGDGEEMTREDFETFVKVYEDNGIPIHWNKGDIAVICNYRFAHGRLGFNLEEGEKRELGVILGEMFPRAQCKDGKW